MWPPPFRLKVDLSAPEQFQVDAAELYKQGCDILIILNTLGDSVFVSLGYEIQACLPVIIGREVQAFVPLSIGLPHLMDLVIREALMTFAGFGIVSRSS